MKELLTLLLFILLSINLAEAERPFCLNLYVYTEGGDYALTPEEYRQCLNMGVEKAMEAGTCLRVKRIRYNPLPIMPQYVEDPNDTIWANANSIGRILNTEARRKKRRRAPQLDVALLPPTIVPTTGYRYISGLASELCSDTSRDDSGVVIARAQRENQEGEHRFMPFCPATVAHELLHGLGARHIEEPPNNLMNTAIAYFLKPHQNYKSIQILPQTLSEVRSCSRRLMASWKRFKEKKARKTRIATKSQ